MRPRHRRLLPRIRTRSATVAERDSLLRTKSRSAPIGRDELVAALVEFVHRLGPDAPEDRRRSGTPARLGASRQRTAIGRGTVHAEAIERHRSA